METRVSEVISQIGLELDLLAEQTSRTTFKLPAKAAEPSGNDLAELDSLVAEGLDELDSLLAESMAQAAKRKRGSDRAHADTLRDCLLPTEEPFEVIENIALWERVTCACTMTTPAVFLHYKEHRVRRSTVAYIKVDKINDKLPLRHVLVQRTVPLCEDCCEVDSEEMQGVKDAFQS